MIQYGPTTGEFAAYRNMSAQTCKDVLASLVENKAITNEEAHRMVAAAGTRVLRVLHNVADEATSSNVERDLLIRACLLGFGWAGMAAHYKLTSGYVSMLDELNGMNVKGDNDLPPTKEKG